MSLSDAGKKAVFAAETDQVFVILLTISHPDLLDGPIRLCSDSKNVTSQGQVYYAFPFELSGPSDSPDQPPEAKLTIDNVSREIIAALRSITSPPQVVIAVVRAEAPDVLEVHYKHFEIRRIEYDAQRITATVVYRTHEREPWPQHRFTPALFPGCF